MLGLLPLRPAYGRDYKNKESVAKDFFANKDFLTPNNQYINKQDIQKYCPDLKNIEIRYSKLRKCTVINMEK